jgi:hypothetical protein
MDDVAVWDVMVDAANNGCVLTSEGVRLAILAADAELKRLREALSEMTAARDECCKTIAELRRRAKEGK